MGSFNSSEDTSSSESFSGQTGQRLADLREAHPSFTTSSQPGLHAQQPLKQKKRRVLVADQHTHHPVTQSGCPAGDVATQLADEERLANVLLAHDQDQILGVQAASRVRVKVGEPRRDRPEHRRIELRQGPFKGPDRRPKRNCRPGAPREMDGRLVAVVKAGHRSPYLLPP